MIYKCVTCELSKSCSLVSPYDNPTMELFRVVVFNHEPHGCTCILSPGASPDTWPDEFQFIASPRTSMLHFATSGPSGSSEPTRLDVIFNPPLLLACVTIAPRYRITLTLRHESSPFKNRENQQKSVGIYFAMSRKIRHPTFLSLLR